MVHLATFLAISLLNQLGSENRAMYEAINKVVREIQSNAQEDVSARTEQPQNGKSYPVKRSATQTYLNTNVQITLVVSLVALMAK